MQKINNITRTEENILQTNSDITDISINIPFIEPIIDGMYKNMSNNGTDDQATIFDDETLSTTFEEIESLSIKQMISKDKRKLSDIIEAGTASTSQKNKSLPRKIQKIRNIEYHLSRM